MTCKPVSARALSKVQPGPCGSRATPLVSTHGLTSPPLHAELYEGQPMPLMRWSDVRYPRGSAPANDAVTWKRVGDDVWEDTVATTENRQTEPVRGQVVVVTGGALSLIHI